jgi:hypothetical protein
MTSVKLTEDQKLRLAKELAYLKHAIERLLF